MIVVKVKIDHGNYQYNEFHLVDLPEEVEKLEKEYHQEREIYLHSYEIFQYELVELDLEKIEIQDVKEMKLTDFVKVSAFIATQQL